MLTFGLALDQVLKVAKTYHSSAHLLEKPSLEQTPLWQSTYRMHCWWFKQQG